MRKTSKPLRPMEIKSNLKREVASAVARVKAAGFRGFPYEMFCLKMGVERNQKLYEVVIGRNTCPELTEKIVKFSEDIREFVD